MPYQPAPRARRAAAAGITLALALALTACADLAAALPPRPTPFPTLARLPSVTPVTPSPTAPPTATPLLVVTPTAVPLLANVATTANVRSGPGIDYAVVGVVEAGAQIRLRGRSGEWFQVDTPDGTLGWMSGVVLDIAPELAAAVPPVEP